MPERPLQHREPDGKDDETLKKEARAHLAGEPALQLVAELIAKLRELDLPWWSPNRLRDRWGAVDRMRWFRERGDLRQRITTSLTGLAAKAARRKTPDFQGALVDSVIDESDITPRTFEEAFDPCDIAVYGPAGAYWNFFRESMPWDQDKPAHQELVAWLLKALLADRSPFDGIGRAPILTPWDVRTAIDGRVWHTRVPLEIRVAIDETRLQQERDRPGVPFHADRDLAIAVPEIIATSIPLRELLPVLLVAQKAMRFEPPRNAPKIENGKPDAGARPSAPPPPLAVTAPASGAASAPPHAAPAPPHHAPAPAPPQHAPAPPHHAPAPAPPPQQHAAPAPPPPPPQHAPAPPPPQHAAIPPPPGVAVATFEGAGKPGAAPVPPPLVSSGSVPPPPLVAAGASPSTPPSAAPPTQASASRPSAPPPAPSAPAPAKPDLIAPPPLVEPRLPSTPGAPPSPAAILAVLNAMDPEDDLERTNPWVVPTPEEIAADLPRPPEGSGGDNKRRRGKA